MEPNKIATKEYRSSCFMQSDVDSVISDAMCMAERFHTPSDFWLLLASEVATEKKLAEGREQRFCQE